MKKLFSIALILMLLSSCEASSKKSAERGEANAESSTIDTATDAADNAATDATGGNAATDAAGTIAPANIRDTLTIAMVGDIMMGTTFPTNKLPESDGANLFRDCADILKVSDFAVGNLEGAMLDGGKSRKTPGPNCYAFRMPSRYVKHLAEAGFDYLGLANNHANDFYQEGMLSSERLLDSVSIANSGIGGRKPYAVVEKNGVKYGCISFARDKYALQFTIDNIQRYVKELRDSCHILIVGIHGGAEGKQYTHLPDAEEYFLGENRGHMRRLAHTAIAAGADVVFCHGPHVPRAVELYDGHFVAYSLGNFCTPHGMNLTGVSGYAPLIQVSIDSEGRFLKGKIHSYVQHSGVGPRKDAANSAAKLIKSLTASDIAESKLAIDEVGNITLTR